jgi:hypothetical protein
MKLLKHTVYSHLVTRKHKKINNTKIKVYRPNNIKRAKMSMCSVYGQKQRVPLNDRLKAISNSF